VDTARFDVADSVRKIVSALALDSHVA
jgi:hypothetical protein